MDVLCQTGHRNPSEVHNSSSECSGFYYCGQSAHLVVPSKESLPTTTTTISSSSRHSSGHSGFAIGRHVSSHRFHPYKLHPLSQRGSATSQPRHDDPLNAVHQQCQQYGMLDASNLYHQPLEKLLDLAISLASRSLARTMDAFQTACECWAKSSDTHLASQALDCAELCMSRTIHRMHIAQQLAAAVIHKEQQSQKQVQRAERERVLGMLYVLQQQKYQAEPDTEAGEEVCSCFRPAAATADGQQQ